MKIFIAALIFIGLAIFIMSFNIIFRKGKKFPDSSIERNVELRKRGITCAREDEIKMWRKKTEKSFSCDGSCADCPLMDCSNNNNKNRSL